MCMFVYVCACLCMFVWVYVSLRVCEYVHLDMSMHTSIIVCTSIHYNYHFRDGAGQTILHLTAKKGATHLIETLLDIEGSVVPAVLD